MERFIRSSLAVVAAATTMAACSRAEHPLAPSSPDVSYYRSVMTSSAASLVADGASTASVLLSIVDSLGMPIGKSAGVVTMTATVGSLTPAVDNHDGTYTAVFTAPKTIGMAGIVAMLKSVVFHSSAVIALRSGPMDLAHTLVLLSDSVAFADGVLATTVTVAERDVNGNVTADGSADVAIATTLGQLTSVTPGGTGMYRAAIRSFSLGTANISATIAGQPIPAQAHLRFAGGFWASRASMPEERQAMGSGVIDGLLYTVGGGGWTTSTYSGRNYAYDPAADSWSTRAPMPTPRGELAAGVVNGKLYAVGGYLDSDLSTVEAYDPKTDTWSARAPMPTAREGLAVAVINGILYAVGGNVRGSGQLAAAADRVRVRGATVRAGPRFDGLEASHPVGTVEAYDPATDSWTTKASMPTPRSLLGVGVINGILYAVGGSDGRNGGVRSLETYDPATDTWTSRSLVPAYGRSALAVGVLNGLLYAIGGDAGYEGTDEVDTYDPATDKWQLARSIPTASQGMTAGVIGGVLYIVGGSCYDVIYSTVSAYIPP